MEKTAESYYSVLWSLCPLGPCSFRVEEKRSCQWKHRQWKEPSTNQAKQVDLLKTTVHQSAECLCFVCSAHLLQSR